MAGRSVEFGIRLRADRRQFAGEVGQAQRDVEQFGQSVDGASTVAIKAGAILGTALVGAVVAVGRAALRVVGDLDDLADRAQGIGLAADRLSAYQITARAAGLSQESLSSSLAIFNRNIAEAAAGNQRAAALFRVLGVEVRDARGQVRELDSILGDVADRFRSFQDGAQKSALAQEAFGRGGAKMVAFLNEGREGLDRFGGASKDQIENAQRLQGEIDKLAASWQRLTFAVAGAVAGAINPLFDRGSIEQQIHELQTIIRSMEQSQVGDPRNLERYRQQLAELLAQQQAATSPAAKQVAGSVDAELAREKAIKAAAKAAQEAAKAYDQYQESLQRNALAAARAEQAYIDLERAQERAAQQAVAAAMAEGEESSRRLVAAAEQEAAAAIEAARNYGKLRSEIIALDIARLEEVRTMQIAAGESEAEIERTQRLIDAKKRAQAATAEVEVRDQAERVRRESVEESRRMSADISRSLTDALLRGFESGKDFAENFRQTLVNMFQTLVLRPIIEPIVAKGAEQLLDLAGDIFISLFGLHSGGIAGQDGFARSVPLAAMRGARRYHRGGVAANEVPALLQAGEEVLTRNDPRHVLNGGGMPAVKVEVHNYGTSQVATRERRDAGGLTIEVLVDALEDRLAGNVGTGRGSLAGAIESRYGLRATAF